MDSAPIVVPVRFAGGGLSMQTTTSRMSAAGAFIRCLVSPKEGSPVLLLLTLPGEPSSAKPLELHAVVTDRVASGGAGREAGFAVKFNELGTIARERVTSFLRSKGVAEFTPPPSPPVAAGVEPAGSRRSYARVPTRMQVGWSSPKEFLVAYSENISRGGIFVSTPSPPPLREVVELLLELPDDEAPARTHAEVVQRVTVQEATAGRVAGAGLQFVGGDDAFRERLDRCIESLLNG